MNQPDNRPIVYMNAGCPFCLSVRIFLLEAKLMETVRVSEFTPGTLEEVRIHAELTPYVTTVAFPTMRVLPDTFVLGSDTIIARLASEADVDVSKLPILDAYTTVGRAETVRLYRETMELKRRLAAACTG